MSSASNLSRRRHSRLLHRPFFVPPVERMPLGGGGAGGGTGGLLDDMVGGDCGMFLIIETYDAASLLQLRFDGSLREFSMPSKVSALGNGGNK